MNKKDITDKFQSFEEREDVKEIMRLFTIVLAQKYETHGVSLSHEKYYNQFLEEFEVPVLDRLGTQDLGLDRDPSADPDGPVASDPVCDPFHDSLATQDQEDQGKNQAGLPGFRILVEVFHPNIVGHFIMEIKLRVSRAGRHRCDPGPMRS